MRMNMRRLANRFWLAMLAVGVAVSGVGGAVADTLIENISVLPMTGAGLQRDWVVLVDGDRIVAAGPRDQVQASPASVRVDGAGGVLLPGLIDMHVHLDLSKQDPQSERPLALYAVHGVTTVRVMWGRDGQLALREAILAENRFAPSLVLAGPGFGLSSKSPAEIKMMVEQQAKAGWNLIKVHWKPTLGQFDAVMAAAKAAGIEVGGHVPYAVALDHVLASGQRSIEHMDGYIRDIGAEGGAASDAALQGLVARTKAAGVAVVPTMFGWRVYLREALPSELSQMPGLAYVPDPVVGQWLAQYEQSLLTKAENWLYALIGKRDVAAIIANRKRLLQAFANGGVPVLFGTDAGQPLVVLGASALQEMAEMRAAGLSNRQIVESATATAGRFLDPSGRLGVIAPGARADMILVAKNPLDELQTLSAPQGVMLRGRWHDSAEIARFRATIAARPAAR
jgi:imidazolonepropionase-like amidohydrolase